MMEYVIAAMVALMALQIIVVIYVIYRVERRPQRTDPVIEAIYQDALKTLAEHAKATQR